MPYTWNNLSNCTSIPCNAVRGGYDCDGSPIYVGRAYHEENNLPAKVIPSKGGAYVCYNGQEHFKRDLSILVGSDYKWKLAHGGFVPTNAVVGGKSETGELLYVGRGAYNTSLCVGKIHPTHGCLYIPFGGLEIRLDSYEVLVFENSDNWVLSAKPYVLSGAVAAGFRAGDRAPIYVARVKHNGENIPAKFVPSKGGAYVSYGGIEYHKNVCEILCGEGYYWVSQHNNLMPPNAVSTGYSCKGDPLFIGRGHYEGSLTPGVISLSQRCLFIPYFGKEIRIKSYEVLCRS